MGAKVPGNESSIGHSFPGAKVPGNERARERIGQGPIGTFAPGSELARERKGQVPDDGQASSSASDVHVVTIVPIICIRETTDRLRLQHWLAVCSTS